MAQVQSLMKSAQLKDQALQAEEVPALAHDEAADMARAELERYLALVETLSGEDWGQPTDCTLWSVADIVAHQAGAYAGFANFAGFKATMGVKPAPGELQIDAINARQIKDRIARTPSENIAELREVGPKAINTRYKLPWLLRKLRVPVGPPLGTCAIEYMTDLLYTRDTWSHRLDIARATGKDFVQDARHDGRMIALVMRDLAQLLHGKLGGQSVVFDLSGPAGDRYRIGATAELSAVIRMTVEAFIRLSSERATAHEIKTSSAVSFSGDQGFAQQVIELTSVPY
jgi:uncharacterized protein (TIGR03083 family)